MASVTAVPASSLPRKSAAWAVLAALVMFLPPLRAALEASMLTHMLVQFPVLMALGWILGAELRVAPAPWSRRVVAALDHCNRWGASGMVLAIGTATLWMLPRLVDAARLDLGWDAAKFACLLSLAGAAAALSWSRCPPILRGVLHLEIIATFWRLGWLFLATDQRLCSSYLLDDQQRTGQALLVMGAAWALAAAWRPLVGAPKLGTR